MTIAVRSPAEGAVRVAMHVVSGSASLIARIVEEAVLSLAMFSPEPTVVILGTTIIPRGHAWAGTDA